MAGLSRRRLLYRLAAMAFGAIGGSTLAGCSPQAATTQPDPTVAVATLPAATATPPPATPAPSFTPTYAPPPPRPEIIRFHPDALSTVVHAQHSGVWKEGNLAPAALRQMLDASITALTGLGDARAAWAALFRPRERIAIKVSTIAISPIWTHVPLVNAVTDCLQEAGVAPEQIVIFDRDSGELKNAGFTLNPDGPGVRCRGTDSAYRGGWELAKRKVRLSSILLECDALINMPILKAHNYPGFTFALKNHYGTISSPAQWHGTARAAIAELNALPPIRERTRLIVGDALQIAPEVWNTAVTADSLFVSFDPVAHDTAGLQFLDETLRGEGYDTSASLSLGQACLAAAAERGAGTNDPVRMNLVRIAAG